MNRTMKIPVMKKVAERLGDIRDEIKEQYDEIYEELKRQGCPFDEDDCNR